MKTKGRRVGESVNKQFPRKAPQVKVTKDDSEEVVAAKFAALFTSPELAASRVISAGDSKTNIGEQIDIPSLLSHLEELGHTVNRGDMSNAEAMLINQATALQSLFACLTEKAMGAQYLSGFEGFMRMALRAQSQSRATLETLSAIKNPPVIITKQLNQNIGPQQINNAVASETLTRENKNQQTQLSEQSDELCPNSRTSSVTRSANQALETLGKVDWS